DITMTTKLPVSDRSTNDRMPVISLWTSSAPVWCASSTVSCTNLPRRKSRLTASPRYIGASSQRLAKIPRSLALARFEWPAGGSPSGDGGGSVGLVIDFLQGRETEAGKLARHRLTGKLERRSNAAIRDNHTR